MIDFLAGLDPQYLIVAFTVLGGLIALPLLFWSVRRFSDWRFASGCDHARWMFAHVKGPNGTMSALIPRSDFRVIPDTWEAAGLRGVHAGPLANAVAAEALTSVLIGINRTYKVAGAGIRITGLGKD